MAQDCFSALLGMKFHGRSFLRVRQNKMLNAGSRLRLLVSESAGSGFGSRIFVPGFALAWTAEAAVATWLGGYLWASRLRCSTSSSDVKTPDFGLVLPRSEVSGVTADV